jgi:hypothetical protein
MRTLEDSSASFRLLDPLNPDLFISAALLTALPVSTSCLWML